MEIHKWSGWKRIHDRGDVMIYIMVMVCVVSIVSAVYLILTMDEWWVQVTNGLISTMEYLSKGRRKKRENIVLKRFWNDWMYKYIIDDVSYRYVKSIPIDKGILEWR